MNTAINNQQRKLRLNVLAGVIAANYVQANTVPLPYTDVKNSDELIQALKDKSSIPDRFNIFINTENLKLTSNYDDYRVSGEIDGATVFRLKGLCNCNTVIDGSDVIGNGAVFFNNNSLISEYRVRDIAFTGFKSFAIKTLNRTTYYFNRVRFSNNIADENQVDGNTVFTVYASNKKVNISNSLFENNKPKDGLGGAIHLYEGNTFGLDDSAYLNISNTTFKGNESIGSGAIYLDKRHDTSYERTKALIQHSVFANNKAGASGGAIYAQYNSSSFLNSLFQNNSANNYGGACVI